jgi:hypothetical protein
MKCDCCVLNLSVPVSASLLSVGLSGALGLLFDRSERCMYLLYIRLLSQSSVYVPDA